MSKMEKVLIIGYGSMGKRRIRLLQKLMPDVSIMCVDSNKERVKQAIQDGHKAYESLDEAVALSPDSAFVCAAPGRHADIILRLIDERIPVFTELNLTADKYDEIKEKANRNNVTVFVSSTMLYKRQMRFFKEKMLEQKKPVSYIYHVGQYMPDWHPWENYKDSFFSKKNTNAVREIMTIQFPWIIDTFGRIKRIDAINQNCTSLDICFPDTVIMNVEHENGNIGSVVIDVTSRKSTTNLEIIGEDIHITWGGHNDDLYDFDVKSKEMKHVILYEMEEHVDGYADNIVEEPYEEEIREFLEVIEGKQNRYGIDEDAYTLKIIDMIERQY